MVKFGDEFSELFYNREILAKLMESEVFRNWPTVDVSKNNEEARYALMTVINSIVTHPHDDLVNSDFNGCERCIAIESLADELWNLIEMLKKADENASPDENANAEENDNADENPDSGDAQRN